MADSNRVVTLFTGGITALASAYVLKNYILLKKNKIMLCLAKKENDQFLDDFIFKSIEIHSFQSIQYQALEAKYSGKSEADKKKMRVIELEYLNSVIEKREHLDEALLSNEKNLDNKVIEFLEDVDILRRTKDLDFLAFS